MAVLLGLLLLAELRLLGLLLGWWLLWLLLWRGEHVGVVEHVGVLGEALGHYPTDSGRRWGRRGAEQRGGVEDGGGRKEGGEFALPKQSRDLRPDAGRAVYSILHVY